MISFARYARLLALPDVPQAFLSSFVGRIPIGIAGLAILLLVQTTEGSYTQAGLTGAIYVAGLAAAAPLLGRMIDRLGPRRVLATCALLYPAALLALVAALQARAPASLSLLFAALAGASFPPVTACQRAWLRQKLGEDALLTAALSLDALMVELVFIAGPLLVALLVALFSPAAAVVAAAICGLLGSLLFMRARALLSWKRETQFSGAFLGPLAEPRFAVLLVLVCGYASVFGLVEIGVTAFAAESAQPALAGVLLGVMSIGSAAGALAYGTRHWHMRLGRQFSYSLALMGIGIAPLALVSRPVAFALWCVVAGIAMTPTLIIQATLVAKSVRAENATEGFTWSATALLAGVGIGLATGGLLLEHGAVATLFLVATLVSIGTAFIARAILRA
ncbi:MAG: MFS transporter [Betaproteobacteria bacterium]|nr:MFS transporter [Betaproteobacteria bacterium]